jgi:hypothetical protein
MAKCHRTGPSHRLLVSAVVGASVVAFGLGAVTGPAVAATAQPTQGHTVPLPKVGPRKTPFSPRVSTTRSATTATPANAADNPWIVGIVGNSPYAMLPECTGTIISPTKVLTAAGCQMNGWNDNVEVIAGRDNLADDSVGFVDGVVSTWVDPNFTDLGFASGLGPTAGSDVQVLTLSQPLPSVYTPITLSAQGDESPYAVGGHATTLGYGLNGDQDADHMQLLQTTVTTQAASVCAADSSAYVPAEEVCESDDQTSLHSYGTGLQGLPLIAGGKQIGIGDSLGRNIQPHLSFERLSVYHDLVTADLARPVPDNLDWHGTGKSDVFGEGYDGLVTDYQQVGTYPTPGTTIFGAAQTNQSPNFSGDGRLIRVNNWGADGQEGLLAVDGSGNLVYFRSNGFKQIDPGTAQVVGSGWNGFTSIVAASNFTGDGRPDLIGVRPDGSLWLYERTATGWLNGGGVQIGGGFNQFTNLMAFQWTDTGHIGLLGVTPGGDLRFYGTDGSGHWVNGSGAQIGGGFAGLRTVLSVGSFGGTDTGSVMTVDNAGTLRVYLADGNGGWLNGNGIPIGVGFQTLKQIF